MVPAVVGSVVGASISHAAPTFPRGYVVRYSLGPRREMSFRLHRKGVSPPSVQYADVMLPTSRLHVEKKWHADPRDGKRLHVAIVSDVVQYGGLQSFSGGVNPYGCA